MQTVLTKLKKKFKKNKIFGLINNAAFNPQPSDNKINNSLYENDNFLKSNVIYEAKIIFKEMNDPTINTVEQSYKMMKIVEEVNENVLPILSKLKDPEILSLIW